MVYTVQNMIKLMVSFEFWITFISDTIFNNIFLHEVPFFTARAIFFVMHIILYLCSMFFYPYILYIYIFPLPYNKRNYFFKMST